MNKAERIAHNRGVGRASQILEEKCLACGEAANTCRAVGMEKEAEHLAVISKAFSSIVRDVRSLMVVGNWPNKEEK